MKLLGFSTEPAENRPAEICVKTGGQARFCAVAHYLFRNFE